jgi:Zn-finger protein
LKQELIKVSETWQTLKCEWESSKHQLTEQIEDLLQVLKQKNEELRKSEKYKPLMESNAALVQAKVCYYRKI